MECESITRGRSSWKFVAYTYCRFQYLVCQFEVLRYLDSEASVLSALRDLPNGLDETYNRMLLGLNPNFQAQILGSLKWLALSRRPLGLDEFAEVFIFRPEINTKIKKAQRLFSAETVLKHFSSLVNTETKDKWNIEIGALEIVTYVRLAHFTVKEYLISQRIEQSSAKQFHFTEENAHLHIAHCCLSYHLYQSVEITKEDDDKLPLKTYTVQNWGLHLDLVPRGLWTSETVRLAELALSMRSKSLEVILFHGRFRDVWYMREANLLERPYCYTAAVGLLELTKLLLREGSRTSRFLIEEDIDLALREAAEWGHVEIVRFLLAERVNTNNIVSGALQAAAQQGHLAVMKVLLENGADIDAHDDRFGSALEAAAKGTNLTALRQLLDCGADVRKAGCLVSCLIAAYKFNGQHDVTERIRVLRLLLGKGAHINKKCIRHRSALNEAIREWVGRGTREFFDLIIRHGADIELNDGQDGSPLQAACVASSDVDGHFVDDSRRKAAIEALLRLGADPNAQGGGQYGNALQKACYDTSHKSGVIQLLLDNGAEINQQGGRYGTALHTACAKPSPETVDILLSRGADVHIQSGEYGSVLQAATSVHAYYDFEKIVLIAQKLLESGADVNAPGGKFGSALQAAVYATGMRSDAGGLEGLLLSKGAEVNMQGGIYGTALQSACAQGRMVIVRSLLSYGAEVNVEGGQYETALQAACVDGGYWKPHYDLARLLIDHGANVHVQGGHYGSAWHAAAAIRHQNKQGHDTLKLLLDKGADINDCRGRCGTALQVALEHMKVGNEDRIHFLLENGADVNLGAGLYGFPLQSACLTPTDNVVSVNTDGLVYLLENCADIEVNKTGGLFGTALQAAAYEGKTKGLRLLLEKGANVNIRGGKYGSALNAAVVKGYWDLVDMLLDSGAEADCYLFSKPDEEWLENVCKEDGYIAVKRYRNFWEKVKLY